MAADANSPAHPAGFLSKLNSQVFKIETTIVVSALILMSVFVFTDVAYQFAVTVGKSGLLVYAILGFIGLMGYAAVPGSENAPTPPFARTIVALFTILLSGVFGYALLNLESATIYRVILVLFAIPVALHIKANHGTGRFAFFIVAMIFSFIIFGDLPKGFSWAQSYSLVLLLWVGFLGASIAAMQRRHLRVDLTRKLCPPKYLALFNAVSYFAAALFTSIIVYLGFIYLFGHDSSYLKPINEAPSWMPASFQATLVNDFPLKEDAGVFRRMVQVFYASSEPGELPDWLKAGAVPISMFLIAVRFLGHSINFAGMAKRGEIFVDEIGGH